MASFGRITALVVFASAAVSGSWARAADAPPAFPKEALDFFETKVRPVFLDRCYNCHDGSGANAIKGSFTLDTREGLLRGGESGKPAVVPGKPDESPLIKAVKWTDAKFRMPPKAEHRLTPEQVADLEKWVQLGAPDPRTGPVLATPAAKAKTHWAFQKPKEPSVPAVKNSEWVKSPVDAFVLARL